MKKETYICDHCKKEIVNVDKSQFFFKLEKQHIPTEYPRLIGYSASMPFETHFCNQLCLAEAIKEGKVTL